MANVNLRIEGENLSATKVLSAATTFVKLLKEIEREVTGKKQATLSWHVNISSTTSLALISLYSNGRDRAAVKIAFDTAQEALARMKIPTVTSPAP